MRVVIYSLEDLHWTFSRTKLSSQLR